MVKRLTQAMVLAAGLGTRMRPLTEAVPKPLVKLAEKALLDHVLDRLDQAGIERIVANVHYMADAIEACLKRRTKPAITISDERGALLDTGGGVAKALHHFDENSFIIHNSDSVWLEGVGSNLRRLVESWDESRSDCLMLLAPMSNSLGYDGKGDFLLDGFGKVRRRPAGEMAPFVFTGVSVVHKRLFDGAPQGAFSLNKLWDSAIETGRLHGIRLEGTWMHIGTPQALYDAEELLRGDRFR